MGGYCCKQRASGPYYRPIYRCYNGSIDAKECDGQTVYSAKKIEGAVLEVVRGYFDAIQSSVDLTIHFYVALEDLQPVTDHEEVSIVQANHCIETKVG